MKQLLIVTICLLTLAGCGDKPFAPLSGDARHRVQQQLDRCLVKVQEPGWGTVNSLPRNLKAQGKALVIAPDGTVLARWQWGGPLYKGPNEANQSVVEWSKSLKMQLANGRWVAYKKLAYDRELNMSILKPVKPLSDQPYIDISKIYDVPMGIKVFTTSTADDTLISTLDQRVVINDAKHTVKYDTFCPHDLAFSMQNAKLIGWCYDADSPTTQITQIPAAVREFIEWNTSIRFTYAGKITAPANSVGRSVLRTDKPGTGNLKILGTQESGPYYVLTPSGDILASMAPSKEDRYADGRPRPTIAILPDGTPCPMKWVSIDREKGMSILRPETPLIKKLVPIIWAIGSQPQLNQYYYSNPDIRKGYAAVVGYNRAKPDRYVVETWAPLVLFDTQARAVALNRSSMGSWIEEMNSAAEGVAYLQKRVPGLSLSTIKVKQHDTFGPTMMKLWIDPRIWAWDSSELAESGKSSIWTCSAICIDPSGYFLMPLKDTAAQEGKPAIVLEKFRSREDTDFIRDETGNIGQIAIVYHNPSLGITIGKMLKPPIRPMKAVSLSPCPAAPGSEQLWGIDVDMCGKRLLPWRKPFRPRIRVIHPESGFSGDDLDFGYLVVSSDGTLRGYAGAVSVSPKRQKTILVNMAEISKKLAYVKKALGDR